MNCPICHDILIDTSHAKCETCRLVPEVERLLGGKRTPQEAMEYVAEQMRAGLSPGKFIKPPPGYAIVAMVHDEMELIELPEERP